MALACTSCSFVCSAAFLVSSVNHVNHIIENGTTFKMTLSHFSECCELKEITERPRKVPHGAQSSIQLWH